MKSTRRGSFSVHRSEETPGSKYSSTSGLSPRGHLERQAEFQHVDVLLHRACVVDNYRNVSVRVGSVLEERDAECVDWRWRWRLLFAHAWLFWGVAIVILDGVRRHGFSVVTLVSAAG